MDFSFEKVRHLGPCVRHRRLNNVQCEVDAIGLRRYDFIQWSTKVCTPLDVSGVLGFTEVFCTFNKKKYYSELVYVINSEIKV